MLMTRSALLPALALLIAGTGATLSADERGDHDHGTVHHPITTTSETAQGLFDRGLSLAYGFNHPEAAQAFREATAADETCAMCYWGLAFVLGRNINAPFDPSNHAEIRSALANAQKLSPGIPKVERAYIGALAERYGAAPDDERPPLDRAYAKAMRRLAHRYPDDLDASVLFADAVMNTMPWNYWTEEGEPKPGTEEFLAALEKVLKKEPAHPGANHYLIHAVEEVRPELALPAAERLEGSPQATGHLIHMASHIYIRVGRYHDASEVNQRAIAADEAYLKTQHHAGDYAVGYMPHNHHFLWAAATFEGRSGLTRETARHLHTSTDPELMRTPGYGTLQHFWVTPLYDHVRFGRWQEILEAPEPDADLRYPRGVWHYARGMALARTGRFEEATRELVSLRGFAGDPLLDQVTIWDINTTRSLLEIAVEILAGELAAERRQYDDAVAHLEKAVQLEAGLTYDEPPPWHYPARQSLGAVLLAAGRPGRAEQVYREDLDRFPRNGWSLFGLVRSLEAQGRRQEAAAAKSELEEAWKRADVTLAASRF